MKTLSHSTSEKPRLVGKPINQISISESDSSLKFKSGSWYSTTGNPSGAGRTNNPSKR